jgi:hypothetical protein
MVVFKVFSMVSLEEFFKYIIEFITSIPVMKD